MRVLYPLVLLLVLLPSGSFELQSTRDEQGEDLIDKYNQVSQENADLKRTVTSLEERVAVLDDIVSSLVHCQQKSQSSDLDARVAALEDVEDVTSQLNVKVTSLDKRVDNLETSGGNNFQDTIFFAALGTDSIVGANPVIFNRNIINTGLNYNPLTGYYTAPYTGIYQFHVEMMALDISQTMYLIIYVDGISVTHADYWRDNLYRSATVILQLQAGQTVHVSRPGDGAQGDPSFYRSYFWGYMISAL